MCRRKLGRASGRKVSIRPSFGLEIGFHLSGSLSGHRTCLKTGQAEIAFETFQSMKTPNRLQTLSIRLSLVILSLGFSALGFVSFIKTQPGYSSSIFSVEHAYSLIGSTFSVLVGATFLVAAITFRGVRTGSEG